MFQIYHHSTICQHGAGRGSRWALRGLASRRVTSQWFRGGYTKLLWNDVLVTYNMIYIYIHIIHIFNIYVYCSKKNRSDYDVDMIVIWIWIWTWSDMMCFICFIYHHISYACFTHRWIIELFWHTAEMPISSYFMMTTSTILLTMRLYCRDSVRFQGNLTVRHWNLSLSTWVVSKDRPVKMAIGVASFTKVAN